MMFGGLSHLLGRNRVKAGSIVGNVVVGGNSGIIYQVSAPGRPPQPPSLPWAPLPEAGAPFEIFNLLSWKSRLSPDLIGRGGELADLLAWARPRRGIRPDIRIRFLVGPGGAGKTRLAAELADALRKENWHAGFAPLERETPLPLSEKGLLLLLDYPEAWRQQVRKLLQESVRVEAPAAPVRLLLLSRRPLAEWQDDILQIRPLRLPGNQYRRARPRRPGAGNRRCSGGSLAQPGPEYLYVTAADHRRGNPFCRRA
jgi:hypothetical protein